MAITYVKLIRNKKMGNRQVFYTTNENFVPEGWELEQVLETYDPDAPVPLGDDNPFLKARKEKEKRENRWIIAYFVVVGISILMILHSFFMGVKGA